VTAVITTIAFSYGSWKLVEKHALRMKHLGQNKYLEKFRVIWATPR
jgi:peptidoglycan/LPS O-acetylase OafA/YrhL